MAPEVPPGDAGSAPAGDVELAGIVKRYAGRRVLDGVSVTIAGGSVHALVGANGAGKSTLGKVVAGVVRPDEGSIRYDGREVRWRAPSDARRAGIALIAQELAIAPELSVMENIFLGVESRRLGLVDRRGQRRRFAELGARWGMELPRDTPVGRLRLADQQKVEILRAIASDARVIVMDEPTSSLTHVETEILHRMVADLRRRGRTVIYVSHFLAAVLEVSDTVTVLRNGAVVATRATAGLTEEDLVGLSFGPGATAARPARRPKAGDAPPALEVAGLARPPAVRDVNVVVRAGEVVGLAGLVGSGRSEILRAVFGVDRPVAGRVYVAGRPLHLGSPSAAVRAGIGYVPESRKDDGLFLEMSLAANTTFAALGSVGSWAGLVRRGAERQVAQRLMARLSIAARGPEVRVGSLSGGNQQKVLFARWLHARPRALLLDEPTRGVDVAARAAIHDVIGELAGEGMGILVVSSEFEELLALCDRLLVVRDGAIVTELAGDAPLERVMDAAFGVAVATGVVGR